MVYGRIVESKFYCGMNYSDGPAVYNQKNPDELRGKCVFVEDEDSVCYGSINHWHEGGLLGSGISGSDQF